MGDALFHVVFAERGEPVENEALEMPEALGAILFPNGRRSPLLRDLQLVRRLWDPYRDHYFGPEEIRELDRQLGEASRVVPRAAELLAPLRAKCAGALQRECGLLFVGN